MNDHTSESWTEEDHQASEPDFYGKWISVKDQLPEHLTSVICFRPNASFDARRICLYKDSGFKSVYRVTHWMPLPEPPKT